MPKVFSASDLIRWGGPPILAALPVIAFVWLGYLSLPDPLPRLAQKEIIAPALGGLALVLLVFGMVFYRFYRAVLYVPLMALHDRFVHDTARRDLIEEYREIGDPSRQMPTKVADKVFKIAMTGAHHDPRRLRISDTVHLCYQLSLLLAALFLIYIQTLKTNSAWFLALSAASFLVAWMSNNEVETEERRLLRDQAARLPEIAKSFGYAPKPKPKSSGRVRTP